MPEIGGTVSLLNASPIGYPADGDRGKWVVELFNWGHWKLDWHCLVDIELELSLVGRPLGITRLTV